MSIITLSDDQLELMNIKGKCFFIYFQQQAQASNLIQIKNENTWNSERSCEKICRDKALVQQAQPVDIDRR